MSVYKKENKFFSLLIALIGLFILFLYTFSKFGDISDKLIENDLLIEEEKNVETSLKDLVLKKNKLKTGDDLSEILKYSGKFSEDQILVYIKERATEISLNSQSSFIRIKSISFEESYVGELGFNESNINIIADFGNIYVLKNFLDYLTDKNSDYQFFINKFSLSSDNNKGELRGIQIPLKYIYK